MIADTYKHAKSASGPIRKGSEFTSHSTTLTGPFDHRALSPARHTEPQQQPWSPLLLLGHSSIGMPVLARSNSAAVTDAGQQLQVLEEGHYSISGCDHWQNWASREYGPSESDSTFHMWLCPSCAGASKGCQAETS
eukprot:6167827-Amphidinium_carterae.1